MLQFFRYRRNQRLVQGMVLLVITAWLALSMLSTCAFPPQYYAKTGLSDCLSDMTVEEQPSSEHTAPSSDACIKSCATDKAKSGFSLTSDTAKGYSLLLPLIFWPFACVLLLLSLSAGSYPRRCLLRSYKPTSLIYQFCSLLN